MIEHRLYSIELPETRFDQIVLCPPPVATWYALKGYTIFDFTASLDMDPEYYEKEVCYEYQS
jgi:hypothetical protein